MSVKRSTIVVVSMLCAALFAGRAPAEPVAATPSGADDAAATIATADRTRALRFWLMDTVPTGYRVRDGRILTAAGREVQLRGINMPGFNADILMPQYLWTMNWKAQIQQVKDLGFNAVRVPFVPDTLYSATAGYFDPALNPEFVGKTPLQILDLWLAEVERQDLYFVLDFHSVSKKRLYNTWYTADTSLTYDGQPYTEERWLRDLDVVARRYQKHAHFIGIDLYNEPTGEVRWGPGDALAYKTENDWKRAAERAAGVVLYANPRLLVFVEGISGNYDGVERGDVAINYGENLRPQSYLPLEIPDSKLVFAPHSYGPDVYMKPGFSRRGFPQNLGGDWELLFGQFHPAHAMVIGEFGGRYGSGSGGQKDVVWQNAFVDYLISKNIRGGFYWCYAPNSADTGGVLDDKLRVRKDKIVLLKRLWGQ